MCRKEALHIEKARGASGILAMRFAVVVSKIGIMSSRGHTRVLAVTDGD